MELKDKEIHFWQIDLDSDSPLLKEWYDILDSKEKRRADRFKFPIHRNRFIHSHAAMRIILSNYININPSEIDVSCSEKGKPFISESFGFHFNLSHSENLAVFAITRDVPIGVDVEYQKYNKDLLEIAKRFFSEKEYQELIQLNSSSQLEGFYNAWTRKEAFIKAVGKGIQFGLDNFTVSLSPEMPPKLIDIHGDRARADKWEIISLILKDHYKVAIAIERLMNHCCHKKFEF